MLREAAASINSRCGDIQAYDRLVESCQDDAYSLAFRLLGEERAAQAAMQAAVESSYLKINNCRGEFRLWFLKILVEVCRSFALTDAKKPSASFNRTDLQSMLNSLPSDQRLAAVLVDVLKLDYDQAARVAGIHPRQIRRSLALARYSLL